MLSISTRIIIFLLAVQRRVPKLVTYMQEIISGEFQDPTCKACIKTQRHVELHFCHSDDYLRYKSGQLCISYLVGWIF